MLLAVAKILFSACVIAFASWLGGKRPELAGFLISLPLLSLMVLPFSYAEYQDSEKAVTFAKSIFLSVPISLLFFVPFLLASRLQWGFWGLYLSGVALLIAGYFIHKGILRIL